VRAGARRGDLGFTLVEVVVVLLVLSLTAAVAVPAFRTTRQAGELDLATERIEALLRLARDSAVRHAVPVTVVVDSASSLVWLRDPEGIGSDLELPQGVTLELTSARARFHFQPSGAAFPDTVFLRSSAGLRAVTLNPWTGHAIVLR
jgi:general secretion pathway protein H